MIKMNKKGFTLKSFLIALVIASIFLGTMGAIVGDLGGNYGAEKPTFFKSYENSTAELTEITENVFNTQRNNEGGSNLEILGFFTRGAWTTLQLLFNGFNSFHSLFSEVAESFGLPAIIFGGISVIFMLIILFKIASAVFRWEL